MSLWNTFLATLLLAALGSFLVAWRRRLIGHSTCFLSLVAWLALTCGVLCWLVWLDTGHFLPERIDLLGCFLVASPLVLPFLPLAATPLAVARNRHRS